MSYSKFGSIVNSDEGITLAVVEEAITYAVNENNKRIKLMSDGADDAERGFNLISENPFPGPEMTLRTLQPGNGIEILATNEGKNLQIVNTFGSEANANFFHEDGVSPSITFCLHRLYPGLPELFQDPSEIEVKGITDRVNVTAGVPWRFHQSGYDCTLNVGAFVLGNRTNGQPLNASWILGYEEQKGEPIPGDPSERILRLTISGLPTFSKPIVSHTNVQLTSADVTTDHLHSISSNTSPPTNGTTHTHSVNGFTSEANVTYSLGVSISSFDEVTGDLVLLLRHLSPTTTDTINLLKIQRISTFTLMWVTDNAVDGSLNPQATGVILSANGLTSNTAITDRVNSLETKLEAKADTVYVDTAFQGLYFNTLPNYATVGEVSSKTSYTYVNDANAAQNVVIATKANSADVYLKTQTYTQAEVKALNDAQDAVIATKAPLNNPTFTGTVSGITKTMVGLSQVDNTSDVNKPISAAGITKNNSQDALISALQQVPYATTMHAVKSYVFQAGVAQALNATGVQSSFVAGANFPFFTLSQPEGYLRTDWTGTRYCNVLAQINFQYTGGANDNQVQIWLHQVGATLPGSAPTTATAVGSASVGGAFSYTIVRSNADTWFTGQFNAILPLVGGRYYTMAMQTANSNTYNVTGLVSLQTLYGV